MTMTSPVDPTRPGSTGPRPLPGLPLPSSLTRQDARAFKDDDPGATARIAPRDPQALGAIPKSRPMDARGEVTSSGEATADSLFRATGATKEVELVAGRTPENVTVRPP